MLLCMFGFLYAPSPSCGDTTKSLYQSIFCGLACRLHTDYHATTRFLVNRDSTFLALAGTALADDDTPMEERTCCNPLANRKPVCCHADSLSYAAAVTVSGLAIKLKDNADDEHGLRKYLPKFASTLITPSRDKATAVLNSSKFPTQQVIEILDQQSRIEKGKAGFLDASEPTSQTYGTIFAHLARINQNIDCGPSLFLLGSSLGRLIYWKDALDDQKSDEKRGRFNPLKYHSKDELSVLVSKEFRQLQSAADNIPWRQHRDLVTSVISHTIHHHQEMVNAPTTSKRKKKKKTDKGSCCHCFFCGDFSCGDCSCNGCEGGGGGCDCCEGCDCCGCG